MVQSSDPGLVWSDGVGGGWCASGRRLLIANLNIGNLKKVDYSTGYYTGMYLTL